MSRSRARSPRAAGRGRRARMIVGFVLLPAFNALVPLLLLPVITSRLGLHAWVGVAIAQSVGSAAAVVVELGWGLSGTQRVARQSEENRRRLIAIAAITKSMVFVPASVGAVIAVAVLVPDDPVVCAAIAIAGPVSSYGTTWVFIGLGRPGLIFLVETLPRAVALVVAAVAVQLTGSLWGFAVPLLASTVLSAVVAHLVLGVRSRHLRGHRRRQLVVVGRAQGTALAGRAVSALYIALPVTLVSIVSPPSVVAVFAAAERLQRMILTGLQAVPNALQGWVGSPSDGASRRYRARRAVWMSLGVGVAAGTVTALVLPAASRVLFSGVADVPAGVAALCGVMIAIVSTSRATGGIALVAIGRIDAIAWSALVGAVLGVPAILLLASGAGALGAVAGEIVAEASVLAVQISVLRHAGRRRPPASRYPEEHP